MRSMFHAIMSVLFLIAYYLSGRVVALGVASFMWMCLYIFDLTLAIKTINDNVSWEKDDEDYGSEQDD